MDAHLQKQGRFGLIAPSGRTILRDKPPGLFEVGTGRPLWRAAPYERLACNHNSRVFLVFESWNHLWGKWFPKATLTTFASRSFESGDLLFRTVGNERLDPNNCNTAGTLVV